MKTAILKAATLALVLLLATGVAFAHELVPPTQHDYGQEVQKKAGEYGVTLSTYPQPVEVGWNKIYVLIKDASGKIVKDAKVQVEYKMDPMAGAEMFAAPSKTKTTLIKGDKYQGYLKLSMDGVWHVTIKIDRAGKVTELQYNLTVFPPTSG